MAPEGNGQPPEGQLAVLGLDALPHRTSWTTKENFKGNFKGTWFFTSDSDFGTGPPYKRRPLYMTPRLGSCMLEPGGPSSSPASDAYQLLDPGKSS